MTRIACFRMYEVALPARAAWHALFARIFRLADVPLDIITHSAPTPIDELWARSDMGCVFMCGWPWAMHAEPRPIPLAAPVPSPARYQGRPVYMTDFVVRAEAAGTRLPDFFAGRMGWTVEHSHSGCNAPRHHLLRYARQFPFREAMGPLITPMGVARAVREGRCDIGPMDSFAHDLLRRHAPEVVEGLRLLESTEPAPIPFLVAAPGTETGLVAALRATLHAAHEDAEAAALMEPVLVSRFVPVETEAYLRVGPGWAREAAAAGMQLPPE
jgi:hypothetical protein